MNKIIFIVEYEAKQPLFLRTEGVDDVVTRLVDGVEVPSIVSRKMIRPLRDTLRSYAKETGDPYINQLCNFPTEQMCCYCIDCLLFGGTNANSGREKEIIEKGGKKKVKFNVQTIQLRSIVHPTDALAVVKDAKTSIETETHTGIKEGRVAEIGQALFSPFQVLQGTRFIGTFMIDLDNSKVTEQNLVNVFATIFMHTVRYGARTSQEGLVEPKILEVVKLPYEAFTSYDLYHVVKESDDWKKSIEEYLKKLKKYIPELQKMEFSILTKTDLIGGEIEIDGKKEKRESVLEKLLQEFRNSLSDEGIKVSEENKE